MAGGDHGHGHEIFSRSIQENAGAAVGVNAFAVVMGVLFGLAYTVLRAVLDRRGVTPDPTALALLLSAGLFGSIAVVPGLKYPPNPPTVGLEETIGARSFGVPDDHRALGAVCRRRVAAGLAWSRRWGTWRATALAATGYAAAMLIAFLALPSFQEVPGPLAPRGCPRRRVPGPCAAEFRTNSLLNQALMWLTIGATWAWLSAMANRVRLPEGARLE